MPAAHLRVLASAGAHSVPPHRRPHLPPTATVLSTAAVTHRPASLLVLPSAAAALAVHRSSYHAASLEALLLRWDASTALFDGKGAVALRLDAGEAAAGRQDLLGRPRDAQGRQLLRLMAAIPLFDVGAIYLALLNEADLAALLDNRSQPEWLAAAAALAAAATAGRGSGREHGEDSTPPATFSVRQQLGSLDLFSSLEAYSGSTAGLQAALSAAVQTVALLT